MSTFNKQNIIAHDIAIKIQHKIYAAQTFLPSEHKLCELYGTSRETIRKSLEQLNELGLIQKIKGKGSMVLDIQRFTFPISGITSFKELNKMLGMNAKTIVLKLTKTVVPDFLTNGVIQPQQPAFYLERLRLINGEPEVLDRDYLLSPPLDELPEKAAADSVYAYLEENLSFDISYATKEITVENPPEEVRKKLKLATADLVVVVRSYTYLADTTLFQITASYHRPDKFKFTDFARRKRILTNTKGK
ncbi:trehalose operon repressor [Liquorilactobacillus oeni]|uniref:trehalose operon repressor n=1 Tax=Liquorilactobacillus oeni TaxID=303241 RepID=UPI000AFC6B14|nr:trehalose operon repressor [Liquorilactobacillus oeni]